MDKRQQSSDPHHQCLTKACPNTGNTYQTRKPVPLSSNISHRKNVLSLFITVPVYSPIVISMFRVPRSSTMCLHLLETFNDSFPSLINTIGTTIEVFTQSSHLPIACRASCSILLSCDSNQIPHEHRHNILRGCQTSSKVLSLQVWFFSKPRMWVSGQA